MPKRAPQEINASSMADIAFLLLVFFLVTTTMDTDYGLARKLPPPLDKDNPPPDIDIKQRNVFVVLANANDQLLVENDIMDVTELKEAAKEFIVNRQRSEELPEWEDINAAMAKQKLAEAKSKGNKEAMDKWQERLTAAELLGPYSITKQVISLQNDRGTSYNLYIQVQNELAAAYNELRDDMSKAKFGMSYNELTEKAKDSKDPALKDKVDAIRTVYPQRISEAEPKEIGG